MIDALIHFGFFTAQTIIIIAAILIVVAGVLALACKGKLKGKEKLKVRKLNKYYEEIEEKMNEKVLTKSERKKAAKAKKKTAKKTKKEKKETTPKKHIFIVKFHGDIKATAVNSLREEITAILTIAKPHDEVFVKLESPGGMVHGYGLAASELQRIKNQHIPLVISVDKVAASGGYMMACVADKILAAPFAIIGSIGVIAQLPNFHRFLKKHNIDFEQITAGEYKRTLTLFGENSEKGRKKAQEEIEDAHELFKEFIQTHRPAIDINKIATGEHWFATRAKDLNLVDEITTSDDYLMKANKEAALYEVTFEKKKGKLSKLLGNAQNLLGTI